MVKIEFAPVVDKKSPHMSPGPIETEDGIGDGSSDGSGDGAILGAGNGSKQVLKQVFCSHT